MDLSDLPKLPSGALFEKLLHVMDELRGPQGCPWDKEQTPASLVPCLLEETYEVIGAIDSGDSAHLKEELGDLLLQVVFHARIGKEEKTFTIDDIVRHLVEKLVRRHPHVFAEGQVSEADEALRQWERIKAREKKPGESLLGGVPESLPALARAYRLGSKASRVGFDWPNIEGVLKKTEEELQELREEISRRDLKKIEEEFGDLLFSLAQTARFLEIHPEEALRKSAQKFQRRFEHMEKKISVEGKALVDCDAEELDRLWNDAKSFTDSVKNL